ncbi:MAG: outer membrane lipoprotein carrier protein LolA [Rhodobacteraceae bacterium]|nr:outer membrane lipoprotein carrier protein LolA [Paracoccaceae bacterium]
MRLTSPLLALAVLWLSFSSAAAEKLPLGEISDYLNSLTTVQTSFLQTNDDGSESTGRLYIKRPGRLRLEYDPPVPVLVLASAHTLAIFDDKSNEPPQTYPLGQTPLSLILQETVDLERTALITGHTQEGTTTRVILQDRANPEHGSLHLWFAHDPIALREWVVVNPAAERTRLVFGALRRPGALPDDLFSIYLESSRRATR